MSAPIALVPLDARPVTYQLPQQLADAMNMPLLLPPASFLGRLKQPGDLARLDGWLDEALARQPQALILAVDTFLYGGLIPSRLGHEPIDTLLARLEALLSRLPEGLPVYAMASLMRIPGYNNAEEEPDYWANYGEALHQFSVAAHRHGETMARQEAANLPPEVLADFLGRFNRNATVLEALLAKANRFEALVFCQDDTGESGLNVQLAERLDVIIRQRELQERVWVQTGADEVASTLLARHALKQVGAHPTVWVGAAGMLDANARYDGTPLDIVIGQRLNAIDALGTPEPETADIWLLVHAPASEKGMGDWCWELPAEVNDAQRHWLLVQLKHAMALGKPVAVADVASANGGDPDLLALLDALPEWRFAYAGWNTPGNTIGTALALAVAAWLNPDNNAKHAQLNLIRLLDDGLYQPRLRQQLKNAVPSTEAATPVLNALLQEATKRYAAKLALAPELANHIAARFPCQRFFEVEIQLGGAQS